MTIHWFWVLLLIVWANRPEAGLHMPLHDFYLSQTIIKHRPELRQLEIRVKIFSDDLAASLGPSETVPEYIRSQIQITVNQVPQHLIYTSIEIDEEAVHTGFVIEEICDIQIIELTNRLLLNAFDEQVNMVRVDALEDSKYFNLDRNRWKAIFP